MTGGWKSFVCVPGKWLSVVSKTRASKHSWDDMDSMKENVSVSPKHPTLLLLPTGGSAFWLGQSSEQGVAPKAGKRPGEEHCCGKIDSDRTLRDSLLSSS